MRNGPSMPRRSLMNWSTEIVWAVLPKPCTDVGFGAMVYEEGQESDRVDP